MTAVDVLVMDKVDTSSLDIGGRLDTNVPCIDLAKPVTTFAQLQSAIAGKIDLPVPAAGLGAIEIRGRQGRCANKPAEFEAIFYGGATYKEDDHLTIPIARNLSCNSKETFSVKPVNMYDLFKTRTCADFTDPNGILYAADIRPTFIARQPLLFESGQSFMSMVPAVAAVDSFNAAYKGTCAAIALDNGTGTIGGQSCINAGGASACAGANLELALLPFAYSTASRDPTLASYAGWNFIGVWTTTGTAGPLAGATVTVDDGEAAKVVYGDLGTTAFVPTAGATATTASGMVMVYTNAVVGVTVAAPGKASRHLIVAADSSFPSSAIVVLN